MNKLVQHLLITVLLIVCGTSAATPSVSGLEPQSSDQADAASSGTAATDQSSSRNSDAPDPSVEAVSDADRMARLEETVESNRQAMESLRASLEVKRKAEEAAAAEFQQLTQRMEDIGQQLEQAREQDNLSRVNEIEDQLQSLQPDKKLAKEKFDLAIDARKTTQAQLDTLEAKSKLDIAALNRLKGNASESAEAGETTPGDQPVELPSTSQTPAPSTETPSTSTSGETSQTQQSSSAESTESQSQDSPAAPDSPAASATASDDSMQNAAPQSIAERKARVAVEKKEQALGELEQDLQTLTESKELLEANIELESQTLETARKQYDNLEQALENAEKNFNDRLAADAPASQLQELRAQITETQQQLRDSRADIRQSTDRLHELRNQLLELQDEEAVLITQADELRQQTEAAKRSELWVRTQQYVITTIPKLLATLLLMFVLWAALKFSCSRARRYIERETAGSRAERRHRSRTLIGVFQNTGNAAILTGGGLMMLDGAGVPIAPLLGGAGVVGLAIAFAAQSLVKDYFCGFILVLENQFKLGDVVTINGMSGAVERITLRITVLRNFDGHVFYIPNGQITSVKNSTEGWARVVLDIGVAYKERVDEVIDVLMSIAHEYTADDSHSDFLLGEPEMFGVDNLADSSVVVKLGLRVRPDKQWAVKRELLQRIKHRFDELGIEIPFPQRTVHHQVERGTEHLSPMATSTAD